MSPILGIIDEALGLGDVEWDKGQIAIRRARNFPTEIPPEPHIDGFASGLNGLEEGKIYSHTALVGVFLTPASRSFAGNLTVWPGSHYVYYQLGHSAAVNTAEIDRVAVYFRVWLRGLEERRWECPTNIWEGWNI